MNNQQLEVGKRLRNRVKIGVQLLLTITAVCVVTLIPESARAQEMSVIKGRIGKLDGNKMKLTYTVLGVPHMDSTYLKKGKFTFNVAFEKDVNARLTLYHADNQRYSDTKDFYLEPGVFEIKAKDSLYAAEIVKGELNKEYLVFLKFVGIDEMVANGRKIKRTDDADEIAGLKERNKQLFAQFYPKYEAFVKEYPDSYFSIFALNMLHAREEHASKVEPLFEGLTPRLKQSPEGLALRFQLDATNALKIGELAPDFVQPDTSGVLVRLSDYRGKYVLLDFWASWCGPCRQDNPYLVKAYQKYKDKNFIIVGVSLDSKRKAWVDAIQNDGLSWTNVSDLGYFKNQVAVRYAIRAVPQNYLIHPDGRIIAMGLHGEALEKTLAEVLE